jgi:hypothetical protein
MEWRAHVPQGEHVLPGWEDSVDVAEWLIDPGRTGSRLATPLAAPVIGAAGVRRLDSAGDVPGVQGASQGSALAGRACRGFTVYAFDERSWAGHDR